MVLRCEPTSIKAGPLIWDAERGRCNGKHHIVRNRSRPVWDSQCVNCGAKLCNHHTFSLRGCMRNAGHTGPHTNYSRPEEVWDDADGWFIKARIDWENLVDRLGRRQH